MIVYEVDKTMIESFILGGKAEFTILQDTNNVQARYRVVKSKDSKLWFIYSTEENQTSLSYQGFITKDDLSSSSVYSSMRYGKNSPRNPNERSNRALLWVLQHAVKDALPDGVHVIHHGKCSVCGRPLKDTTSLMYGVGPVCRERLQK